jgi:hypothetical protein
MNKCRFCEHGDDLSGIPNELIDTNDMAYCYIGSPRIQGSYFLNYGSPGDGYDGQDYQAKINYCPMCGRKLVE